MRVTVSGASGLIGGALVAALRAQGEAVTALSRDPERTHAALGVPAFRWDPAAGPPPTAALAGRDAVVHLAGEPIAQRWTASAKREIRDSRVLGTRNLVACLEALDGARPGVLVSGSAIGYYGPHGEEPLDEDTAPGHDFLAQLCVAWEAEAKRASELGLRVASIRTGVVLDPRGGALAQMLLPFRLGLGGPVAGGNQYVSWVHPEDLVGLILTIIEQPGWSGAVNGTAPEPVTNRELARALGRALHRPALLPVPAALLRARYGAMATILTTGARVLPAKALVHGYDFRHPSLDETLAGLLG